MFCGGLRIIFLNPLYDATIGTSFTSGYTQFTNNFYTEWFISPEWKTVLRFSVTDKRNQADSTPPTTPYFNLMSIITISC